MRFLLLAPIFLVSFSFADDHKHSYQVNGMHCGGCVKNVEREVCKMDGIENCKVSLIDAKKQIGKVEFSLKPGSAVTSETVKDVVENKAGYQFAGPYKESSQKKVTKSSEKKSN